MTKYSDEDVDRVWGQEELNQLSEKDLTKLSFQKNIKNIVFFGIGAFIIAYIDRSFGVVGSIVGWVAIVIYCFFALEPLMGFLITIISLFGPLPGKSWKLIQILVAGFSALLYGVFAFYIYSSMHSAGSVHVEKIRPDNVAILKNKLMLTDALEIITHGRDIESVKAYFTGNSERYRFIASQKQDVMLMEGYSILDRSSPIIGYSLFYHEASNSLAIIDASINPFNSGAVEALKELLKKAYDSISAGGESKLFFLGIYDLDKDRKLKIIIREGKSPMGVEYAIRYAISSN